GLLIGLLAGTMGGLLAGLAGLGGGLVYVPVFYATMPGDQQGMSLHILGSMVAIIATGFFSTRSHWRLGHIHRPSFRQLTPGLVLGAGLGLWLTLRVPEVLVLSGLALIDGWIAFDYGRDVRTRGNSPSLVLCSGPVGYISGTLGIGGGTMLVPLLRRSLSLREAVGTSALCGLVMAAAAVFMNITLEPAWRALIGEHILFLGGTWLGILLILPLATGWSARLHARLPEATMRLTLKILFACLSAAFALAAVNRI
ncbi:MAG: sulfite exporter TauE/SafE family protein, partial [Mariprofundaceae bacterium]|nr:sulfite exporter TauE/SafE family protein [Mariprofundaceae bacterium]